MSRYLYSELDPDGWDCKVLGATLAEGLTQSQRTIVVPPRASEVFAGATLIETSPGKIRLAGWLVGVGRRGGQTAIDSLQFRIAVPLDKSVLVWPERPGRKRLTG